MKHLVCLALILLAGCAHRPSETGARLNAVGDVIELPAHKPQLGARRFGFDCGVLLRDDFTRFHEGECQRQISGEQAFDAPRELAVHDITPES